MKTIEFKEYIGKWVHHDPIDTDDYLAVYEIGGDETNPTVTGYDSQDNERFVISGIVWDGETLRFKSLMPSTRREGVNRFRLDQDGTMRSEFTFTVIERMKRIKDPNQEA